MDKELIDKAWACLLREFKEKVKKEYARCVKIDADDNPNLPAYAVKSAISRRALLEKLFGEHNLTSDAEGEVMLTVSRKRVQFEFVGISEIDAHAVISYNAAHGETPNYGDISKIDWAQVPGFDLFTYSFPCQSISNAGYYRTALGGGVTNG